MKWEPDMTAKAIDECSRYIFREAKRELRKRMMARYRRTGRRHGR